MAQLYFYYSAMNAGKSTHLLQAAHNYKERNMLPLLLKPSIDTRDSKDSIKSRIGLELPATTFTNHCNLLELAASQPSKPDCILVDEAQFLTRNQVADLCKVVDTLNIPVLAFGLRTDFLGELFEGSKYLLAWADKLSEIKSICHTGKKATMVLRVDKSGNALTQGDQIEIGGNDRYVSVSRKEFSKKVNLHHQ